MREMMLDAMHPTLEGGVGKCFGETRLDGLPLCLVTYSVEDQAYVGPAAQALGSPRALRPQMA